MPDDPRSRWWLGGAAALFALIAALIVVDLVADYREGSDRAHIAVEASAALLALAGLGLVTAHLLRTRDDARRALVTSRAEAERWKCEAREVLDGLGAAIDRQFSAWDLSEAEREVGLLLLKGLSHKEIAQARSVSERTARNQARAVYRKADLHGRAELSAFFLEDLLLPGRLPPT